MPMMSDWRDPVNGLGGKTGRLTPTGGPGGPVRDENQAPIVSVAARMASLAAAIRATR